MIKNILRNIFSWKQRPVTITPKSSSRAQPNEDNLKKLRLLSDARDWLKLSEEGKKILLDNPYHDEAMTFVAYALQQLGNLQEAALLASQAATLAPEKWSPNFIAGISLKGIGREKEACIYLRQALVLSPNDQQTLRRLIEAITVSEGIETAASEYAAHCRMIDIKTDFLVAPISTVQNWAKKIGLPLLEVGEIEEIPFKLPHDAIAVNTVKFSNKPYVADIKNARIFGNSSIILTADGTALSETAGHPEFGKYVGFSYEKIVFGKTPEKLFLNFGEFKTREIEAGVFLSGLASGAFGHWFPEFLPKLQFLQQHPDFLKLPIIVDADMPQSHFDHLQRLTNNQLILLGANESLICNRLLVAPPPTFFATEILSNYLPSIYENKPSLAPLFMPLLSPRGLHFVRGETHSLDNIQKRRIFLARKNMGWRRLNNEDEIATDLLNFGFEIIYIEAMSAREQIELFQQVSFVVAPDGSAILNLIFANAAAKVVSLQNQVTYNWSTFQEPLESLGCQIVTVSSDYEESKGQKHSNYTISKTVVRKALFDLGIHEAGV